MQSAILIMTATSACATLALAAVTGPFQLKEADAVLNKSISAAVPWNQGRTVSLGIRWVYDTEAHKTGGKNRTNRRRRGEKNEGHKRQRSRRTGEEEQIAA